MAGDSMVIDSSSNRVLWQFISGTGVLRPQELIEHEVERNKSRLLNGLLYYKPRRGTAGEELKKERKVAGRQLEFVVKLSKFLDVSEVLCHDLFCAFLFNDYRGSKKTLKQVLSHERHCQALMLKIRDFYFTERLYLLRCLHHMLVHRTQDHPYQDVYSKFCKEVQDNGESLQDKILKQLTAVCETPPPSQDRHGSLMTNVQVQAWVIQNLKEQCELLEMGLMVHKDSAMKGNTLLAYFQVFKKHGFGRYQTYKHLLDESTEKYIHRIRHLEMVILMQGVDVGRAMQRVTDSSLTHGIVSKKETFEAVQTEMSSLGSDAVHGPLLLAWAMVRHFHLPPDQHHREAAETRRLGKVALQLGAFRVLLDMLGSDPFAGTSVVGAVTHFAVYQLVHAVLSVFQEDTLGSSAVLYELCGRLLRQPAVAQDVWEKDDGLWLLYESAMGYFPLDFSRFISMTEALASASPESAIMVKNTLRELSVYTEYLDNNSARHLQPSPRDPNGFILTVDKQPYLAGDFVLPHGSNGQVIELSALPQGVAEQLLGPLIRWEVHYNGWSLLLAEVGELLRQITHGAGMVQGGQVQHVTMVMELVLHVLKADTATATQEFAPFLALCYDLIHRFSVLRPAPLDLLSAALNCIACAATVCPKEVWHKVTQTGLLPYLTENVDDLGEVLSGRGLNSGSLGSIQAGTECTQARYPLTLAILDMLTTLVETFSQDGMEEELLACLLHILKEVFPLFRKWRYAQPAHRKLIGQQCLKLFHNVLNLTGLRSAGTQRREPSSPRPTVHEVCVYSLLFTEAGRALMEIVATGVDNVETALLQQGSLTEGGGVDLIRLIQLALSVLNRLLLLRSPSLPPSPVEQALSWQPTGRQSQHVVATMAQYIYHRHNPKLPTLATQLLKRLALMSPMSILACLGNDAEPIRDIYLTRLQALSEDLRLKVAILELLSVCVETQPGLIEIFFDVQVGPSESADGKKGLELGRSSCLQTLLTLMDVQKQTTYHCPPDLLRAGLDLVHSLWKGRRETAMEALRSKQSFWASVTAPLKRDLLPSVEDSGMETGVDPTDVKIVAFSFRILAQEIYTVEGSRLDPQLKTCLQELGKTDRLVYWSQCVCNSLRLESSSEESSDDNLLDNPTILLLKAWRNFLLVISKSKVSEDLQVTGRRKEQVMAHLLEGLQAQFSGRLSVLNMKVAAIITALYFTLLKAWGSGVGKPAAILVGVRGTVEETCGSSETLIPGIQIGLLAALTLLIQRARGDPAAALTSAAISTLIPVTSSMLLQSTRQLPPPAELTAHGKMDTSSSGAELQQAESSTTSKLMLQVTLCSLLTEIVTSTDVSSWLPHLQEHGVLTALLVSVETYLKAKQGLSYVHSALLLLAAVADSHKGATMLCGSDFTAHTCLPVSHLYLQDDLIPTSTFTAKGAVGTVSTWHGVYCLTVELYTLMLRQQGFSFLDDALNFLGAHQDRLQQSLELARLTLLEAAMREAECTCNFLHQMALYRRQWRLHLPQTMLTLLSSMLSMVQTFVSLLIRPRYLQHVLERGGESGDKGKRSLQSSPLLQHQTSTDDVDHPTSQLITTENSMLRIIGKSLAVLRSFSPDLCQVLLDQSMDMYEFEPLVDLGFSTPTVDQESPLTFGSLISCVTACLRRLHKEHKSPSPHRVQSPHRKSPRPPTSTEPQVPKALLHYVMENCLTLAMSQACRYLREPSLPPRDKHFLKRELGTELNSFLSSMLRHFRRGATPGSPGDKGSAVLSSPQGGGGGAATTTTTTTAAAAAGGGAGLSRSMSQTTFSSSQDQQFFRLLQEFVRKVLR
ncbi:nucleoporin NUP188-like [Babylonia areolata]|uniref:nucleoporin NUP188-like n=1 Tax=Babylonia areolata TaxID=304850 RepID=UPI003FD1E4E5